ncbi:MAG: helix-turn-helix transcriptional regulator [Lachnospiraceae bacterium]|nr:helix-turn-helix transcriptional regulator [Lachnospiraceae bacterium]
MTLKRTFDKAEIYRAVLTCLLIASSFFWGGSGFMTWTYGMNPYLSATGVLFYGGVVGYLMQAGGLFFCFLGIRKGLRCFNMEKQALWFGLHLAALCVSVMANRFPLKLGAGLFMNLMIGITSGIFLLILAKKVPDRCRGLVFGVGYAMGSLGSWGLSLLGSSFIQGSGALAVYTAAAILSIILLLVLERDESVKDAPEGASERQEIPAEPKHDRRFLWQALFLVFFLSLTVALGDLMPMKDVLNDTVPWAYTRAFYAISLLIAGLLNDRSRKTGAIISVMGLILPFAMFVMHENWGDLTLLLILAYLPKGIYTVFRVLLFQDLTGPEERYLYLAPLGLLAGRLGDATGTGLGIFFGEHMVPVMLCALVGFFATSLLAWRILPIAYRHGEATGEDAVPELFGERFGFSRRESEVFEQVLEGKTNAEIAERLYISESTVKFHVKNILRKTECGNRGELLSLYRKK